MRVNKPVTMVIVACSVFLLLLGKGCLSNLYLYRDAEAIRAHWLKETPLGTSIDDVEANLRSRGLSPQVSKNAGFLKQEPGNTVVVGQQSIRLHLGTYRSSPFAFTSVTAFWGFNERHQLIDIWIWKATDSL